MMKVSFTLLSLWEKNKDEAIAYYLGSKKEPTEAMLLGIERDNEIRDYIEKYHKLPDTMGGTELKNPISQKFMEVEDKDNDIKFVFVPDLIDEPILYEFKTGKTDISQYLSSLQIPSYFYLLDRLGIFVDRAYLINEKQGWYLLRNSEDVRKEAKEWLYSNANEMRNYLIEAGIK